MKNKLMRQFGAGTAMGLTLFLGCTNQSAQTEPVKSVQAAPAVANPVAPAPAAPVVEKRTAPAVVPENLKITPGLAEVIQLAQAGVSEQVMLAYVNNSEQRFTLGPDEIVYLNDLGVTSPVITAMIQRDGKLAATKPAPAPVVANVPAAVPAPVAPPVAAPIAPAQVVTTTTYVAPVVQEPTVAYFYDSLSPYGTWVNVSGVGMCWQPTVAVASVEWRPYSDRGRWLWSDSGWYWQSDYSWGWAAFHYGRWHRHDRIGWVWRPDTIWGPAWVSWRYTDTHCGWAPLPPAAHYVSGVGFRYQDRHVGVGFDFGLTDFHYTFIGLGLFCDYNPHRHYEPRNRVTNVYKNSTVINNYVVGNNNTIINNGVGRDTVVKVSQTPVRNVAVRETPVQTGGTARFPTRAERVEKEGNSLVVYRPQLPKTPPATLASSTTGNSVLLDQLRKRGEQPQTGPSKSVPSATVPAAPKTGVAPLVTQGNNPATTPQSPAANPALGKNVLLDQLRKRGEQPQADPSKSVPSTTVPAAPKTGVAPIVMRGNNPVTTPQAPVANPAPGPKVVSRGNPGVNPNPQPNPNTVAKVVPPVVSTPAPIFGQPRTVQPQPTQPYESPAAKAFRERYPGTFEHRPATQQPQMRNPPADVYRQPAGQPATPDRSTAPGRGRQDSSSDKGKSDRPK